MLSIWDILGLIVLAGPLFIVLIGLVYLGIETGIVDWRRRSHEAKRHIEIGDQLLKYQSYNTQEQRYVEEIIRQQDMDDSEIEDNVLFFIKWLMRIIILPFTILSFEAYRTYNILWSGSFPFVTHALAIAVLSSSIVVVSTYYGFFVKYGKI